MAGVAATDPVAIINQASKHEAIDGSIIITLASCYSSFGMTISVRNDAQPGEVKQAFGRCAQWNADSLMYTYKGYPIKDDDTSAQLGIENNDTTQVTAESFSKASCSMSRKEEFTTSNFELLAMVHGTNSLLLHFKLSGGIVSKRYRIRPETLLRRAMRDFEAYAARGDLVFGSDGEGIGELKCMNDLRDTDDDGKPIDFDSDELQIDCEIFGQAGGCARGAGLL